MASSLCLGMSHSGCGRYNNNFLRLTSVPRLCFIFSKINRRVSK